MADCVLLPFVRISTVHFEIFMWNMPTGEPPQKTKGSAPLYLPHKVVWKKYNFVSTKEQKITKKDKDFDEE